MIEQTLPYFGAFSAIAAVLATVVWVQFASVRRSDARRRQTFVHASAAGYRRS